MKFSAKTNTSNEWKAVISAITTLVEEATFEATVEGISFRGMDPSHVALIDISWPNSAFEKYDFGVFAGINYHITDNIILHTRISNSIIPIRPHNSGATFGLNKGQYNTVLSFAIHYKIR